MCFIMTSFSEPVKKDISSGLSDMSEMAPSLPMAKAQDMKILFKTEIEYLQLLKPRVEPMIMYEDHILKLYPVS